MTRDEEFVEQFERLLQHIEQVIQEFPPEMHAALRDEARVAVRMELQQRWEEQQRMLEGQRRDR
jgi:hypothetical protein